MGVRHRAVTRVHMGGSPAVEPGELIPETYLDGEGVRRQVDFERLIDLGAAEPAKGKGAKADPEPEPDAPEPETKGD